MSAPAPADLTLVSITKRYGTTTAVERVSLDVGAGEFLTLLGPSGCGKTTLLKSVAGFLTLDEGEVVLRGRVITDELPHRRNIGIVFQNYALFPHMTVAENIAFGLRMRKVARPKSGRRVEEMLELVKLPGFARRYPHELSGGQQQRVALARVLAVQPELLLLDEPFGALDRKLRIEMQIEVKQLIMALGITTLFVTHDQEEAMRMSDRVAVMNAGRIIQCDMPAAVYDHPADLFVADFIGASNRLPAKVLDGGRLEVAGTIVRTAAPLSGLAGPEAVLVIRPENLSLTAEACPDRPAWRGRVTFALQAGPIMEYEVELEGGARVRVTEPRTRDKRAWRIGAEVSVAIADPDLCRVYVAR